MIERLINLEHSYGEPQYSKLSEEVSGLRNSICGQLNQEGQKWFRQLTDAYMRQEDVVLRDAFADGFWTAVELMREFERWTYEKQN